jgi:Tfp pilus assembly protein PilW
MVKRRNPRTGPGAGFTLVEVVVATALSTLVVAGTAIALTNYRRTYERQSMMVDMTHNARFALDAMVNDVQMAGYGLRVPDSELDQWVSWVAGVTNALMVRQGASATDPDELTIIAAGDDPDAQVRFGTASGATTLEVNPGLGTSFNAADESLILVGKLEVARVIGVFGDELTVSTHPTDDTRGLKYAYPAGSSVQRVKVVTYACDTAAGTGQNLMFLKRDENGSGGMSEFEKVAAVGVENLQIALTTNAVTITLTCRTEHEERGYVHPTGGDGYRRLVTTTTVYPRNLSL